MNNRDNEKDVEVENGRIITLVFDDYELSVTFKEGDQVLDGEFNFVQDELNDERYLLRHMYSPKK